MIDQATIERIMDAAQIVDVVSEFVTLRKTGVNYKGLCPFHPDKTPSFIVSPAKGLCKCFSCGKGGNAVHFIMEHEQMNYVEALRWLAKKYHIEIQERELSNEEKKRQDERESMFIVNEFACHYFQDILQNNVDGRAIGMAYFRSRGFRDDTIRKFQLGYSLSERDALAREALKKGYNEKYLLSTGLCYKQDNGQLHDRFWGRAIFPVHAISGKVVAFGGRVLDSATKGVKMKYVNSPESEIYNKSRELYGLYQAKQAIVRQDRCFLVEGYTDVISMHQVGIENVVSSSGTSLTVGQIRLLHRFSKNITLLYDGDEAGIKASLRGVNMLLEENMNVKILLLPNNEDPDSYARSHTAQEFQDYIEANQVDFIHFKTKLLLKEINNDPLKKAALIRDIEESIAAIPEEIVRSVYIKECARLLNVKEEIILNDIITTLKAQKEKEYNRTKFNENQPPQDAEGTASTPAAPSEKADSFLENIQLVKDTTDTTAPPISAYDKYSSSPFFRLETIIMRELIRYGEEPLANIMDEATGEAMPITVIEYIDWDLRRDHLSIHTELYQAILKEALLHINDKEFKSKDFFMSHPNPIINRFASEFCADRHFLSKMYFKEDNPIATEEEEISIRVPHLMNDLKLAFIEQDLVDLQKKLLDPNILSDMNQMTEILTKIKTLNESQSRLAKKAGDRVILRR